MFRRLMEVTTQNQSSLWFILLLCFLLYLWTTFVCCLPQFIKVGKNGLSYISALGAGLMVGAAFIVVIPESISDAIETLEAVDPSTSEMSAYRLIGICITSGFAFMMIVDSLTHKCSGHSHDHGHDEACDEVHDHDDSCEKEHKHDVVVEEHADNVKDEHECLIDEKRESATHHSYQATVWGLCLHSIFDGVAIGSTMLSKDTRVLWVIFFAIVLHKSAAAFGLGAYFKKLGLTLRKSSLYVTIFAATTPIATFLVAALMKFGTEKWGLVLPIAFAFSAGTFLYVSITHIVPEIGSNLMPWHLIAMLIGIMLPYFLFIDA